MTHCPTFRSRCLAVLIAAAGATFLSACEPTDDGPVIVSGIGASPALRDANRLALDAPSAFMAQTTAQGLVRFDATGQIEPALAQRWIVSDDGLRYTFRLGRFEWSSGGRVTAPQVVARLRSALGPASRNRLKPSLGAVDEIVAMTDDVLEVSLKAPRPNFLQLLAQPELAIVRNGVGAGPYRALENDEGALVLKLPNPANEDETGGSTATPPLHLRGESAAKAIVRFRANQAHLVTGGSAGDLPLVRLAALPPQALRFDPVGGLFGLAFSRPEGPLADPEVRNDLSMAIDRTAMVADLAIPGLQPRVSLLPAGTDEIASPALPTWAGLSLEARRETAYRHLAATGLELPLKLRVALPPGPGYRIIFARLRSDWRRIGVDAEAVAPGAPADLRLIDEVAPVTMASWYLRHFTCSASPVCSLDADQAMDFGRLTPSWQARRESLAQADALLRDVTPFIALTAPVRWSLVSPRLTGFQPSVFGLHAADELIQPRR